MASASPVSRDAQRLRPTGHDHSRAGKVERLSRQVDGRDWSPQVRLSRRSSPSRACASARNTVMAWWRNATIVAETSRTDAWAVALRSLMGIPLAVGVSIGMVLPGAISRPTPSLLT